MRKKIKIILAGFILMSAVLAPQNVWAESAPSASSSILNSLKHVFSELQKRISALSSQARDLWRPKPLPDLWVAALGWSGDITLTPEHPALFTAIFVNQGQADIEKSFTVRIGDATERVRGLKVGETVNVTANLTFHRLGTVPVRVTADANNTVSESNEDNNTFVKNIKIVPR